MRSSLQLSHLAVFLFAAVRASHNDYFDVSTNYPPEVENKYPVLAKLLKCSELVVRHNGVKTDEIQTNSIYREPLIQDGIALFGNGSDEKIVSDSSLTENESKANDEKGTKTRSKRGAVIIERLWTAENISIIDGYSKVAFYPPKPEGDWGSKDAKLRVKRMTSSENDTNECTAPFDDDGTEFNWYQIIVNNGGPPGEVNATLLSPNATKVLEPCQRPINHTSPPQEDILYNYELIEFEKIYRQEKAFVRFAGTPSEFVDIVGHLVWPPPNFTRRYYSLSYRKDDTGFYVNVRRRHKCTFEESPLSVKCDFTDDYTPCNSNSDVSFSLPAGLQASLIG